MCKHVTAVLYGIGTRLDEDPKLFFELRKAKVDQLINQALQDKTKKLLEKAEKRTSKVIDDDKISSVFGLELDEKIPQTKNKKKASVKKVKRRTGKKKPKKSIKKATKTRSGRKAVKETSKKRPVKKKKKEKIRRKKKI